MFAKFDTAVLGIVAYAKILADGSSTVNSGGQPGPSSTTGIVTTKTATGIYTMTLPTAEGQSSDVILATARPTTTGSIAFAVEAIDTSATTKTFCVSQGSTLADAPFDVVIFRTTLPTP
jgi:hypothetical protein